MLATAAPAIPRVLSDEEIEFFREQGYVLVRDVLTREEAERYRRMILDLLPRDLTIPPYWHASAGRIKPYREDGNQSIELPELLPLLFNERLYAAAVQLLGDHRLRSFDASLGITIRNDAGKGSGRHLHQTPHIDCSVPADIDNFLFTPVEVQVGGCYYFTDVEQTGGGIYVLPGGHRWVESMAQEHPQGRHLYQDWKRIDGIEEQMVEVTGPAGSFAMLHHLMPHGASFNRMPTARVAQFTRFTRHDHPHNPWQPAPEGRWSPEQLAVMSPLGRKLLGADPW